MAQAFLARLKTLDFFNLITLFGAAFLFSTLPLIIILGTFADRHVDSDLSDHLGLNAQAAKIVNDLSVTSSSHSTDAVVTASLLSLAGTVALAASVQTTYEQVFGAKQPHGLSNIVGCRSGSPAFAPGCSSTPSSVSSSPACTTASWSRESWSSPGQRCSCGGRCASCWPDAGPGKRCSGPRSSPRCFESASTGSPRSTSPPRSSPTASSTARSASSSAC